MDRDRIEQAARHSLQEAQERHQRYKWVLTAYGWLRKTAQSIYDRVVPPLQRLLAALAANPAHVTAFAAIAATAGLATVAAIQADRAADTAATHRHTEPTTQPIDELRQTITILSADIAALHGRVDELEDRPPPVLEITALDLVAIEDRVDAATVELGVIAGDVSSLAATLDTTPGRPSTATTADVTGQIGQLADRVEAVAAEVEALAAMVGLLAATTTPPALPPVSSSTTAAVTTTTAAPTTTTAAPAPTTTAPPPPTDPPIGGGGCDPLIDPACP